MSSHSYKHWVTVVQKLRISATGGLETVYVALQTYTAISEVGEAITAKESSFLNKMGPVKAVHAQCTRNKRWPVHDCVTIKNDSLHLCINQLPQLT